MRKMHKIINTAVIFMILGCWAAQGFAYSSDMFYLRVPMGIDKKRAAEILANKGGSKGLPQQDSEALDNPPPSQDTPNLHGDSDLLKHKVTKEGLLIMRDMIKKKLLAFEKEKRDRPLLVVICGRPGTGKTTVANLISSLRFGLKEGEVSVFEHDEGRSMLRYTSFMDPALRLYLKKLGIDIDPRLIVVEGYNIIPGWADENSPDLVIEFTAEDDVRLKRISGRGWPEEHTRRLANAPRIPYKKIDLFVDNNADLTNETDFIKSCFGSLASETAGNNDSAGVEAIRLLIAQETRSAPRLSDALLAGGGIANRQAMTSI